MKSNTEWKMWGERDPLYAVATWSGKERGSSHAWTDKEFYELGSSDWEDFSSHWRHYGLKLAHCVEIGCGAGRFTKQLARCFQEVTAVDVSQHQLDYARSRIPEPNVAFVLNDGIQLPVNDGKCDALFSAHVFQHFESLDDAWKVFREIHRALSVDGSLMIHLPIYQLPDMRISSFFRPGILVSKYFSDLKAAADRKLLLKGKWRDVMRRLRFEREELIHALREIGFTGIEFRAFPVRSNGSYHDFVFARKSA